MVSKYLDLKTIKRYLYDQLTGNFLGFIVGISASSLVSKFFATRSVKNLWGLASKKTVVDKDTFSAMEWIISIIVGFIVFEIVTKIVKEKVEQYYPLYKVKVLRYVSKNNHQDAEGIKGAIKKTQSEEQG
jgi:hypothetical protein